MSLWEPLAQLPIHQHPELRVNLLIAVPAVRAENVLDSHIENVGTVCYCRQLRVSQIGMERDRQVCKVKWIMDAVSEVTRVESG